MRIITASDHSALSLRAEIKTHLEAMGHTVIDLGPFDETSADYPLYGAAAARMLATGAAELGIIFCGSGLGISLAANKVPGIRCCVCSEPYTAKMSRLHNNANMLAIGARVVGSEMAKEIVRAFVEHEFEGGRHARRVRQLRDLEENPQILDEAIEVIFSRARLQDD